MLRLGAVPKRKKAKRLGRPRRILASTATIIEVAGMKKAPSAKEGVYFLPASYLEKLVIQ